MNSRIWLLCLLLLAQLSTVAALPKVRVSGRSFVTETGQPFIPMGVNYYRPGTGWAPQLWKKFDPAATRQDFARMKDLGVNCVRVFLTYGSFYMEQDKLSPDGLRKFDQFLQIAEQAGIYVHPTGPDHWEGTPEWARGDRYADDKVLRAVDNFWKLFAERYRGRNVIFAYDLLNEPEVRWDSAPMRDKWNAWREKHHLSQVPIPSPKESASPELLEYQLFRESIAEDWTRRQVAAIKSADPNALVTVGLIQWSVPALLPGVQHYSGFRPERQAKLLDFMEVHFYPLNSGWFEYRSAEEEGRNLSYLESVVREVSHPGKPVVVAEFGWYGGGKPTVDAGKHAFASEQQQAHWCKSAVETTAGLATGWLNWGFYDHPEAADVSQFTGMLTVDGNFKAWGKEFKSLTARYQNKPISAAPTLKRPNLDWDLCLTNPKAAAQFRDKYYEAFSKEK